MNILLINHYAGSPELGMEFRPYYMAKEWVKAGHQVLIVGGSFSHLRKVQPQGKEDLIEGIHYRWVKLNAYKGNGIGRIRSMFSFVSKLWWGYKKYIGDFEPNVVIASLLIRWIFIRLIELQSILKLNWYSKYMIYAIVSNVVRWIF